MPENPDDPENPEGPDALEDPGDTDPTTTMSGWAEQCARQRSGWSGSAT